MIPGIIVVIVSIGAILLVLVAILAVSIHVFARLQTQQRQIEALEARVDLLAGALADRSSASAAPATPPVSPAAVPVPRAAPSAAARSAATAPSQTTGLSTAGTPQSDARESLETRIGSRWLLYVGVAAIVIGAAYFEKLAFENRWVSETARVIQGGVAGLALVYAGMWFRRAGYSAYGQMISGCGAAILYVCTYAAFNFYHLIDRPIAFGLMIAVTAGMTLLADRQRSQGLAVLAVGGGFATPFLLPGTSDAQIALFGYDAVLIAGTVALSRRRDWPLLDVLSYVFTLVTVAAWAERFYLPRKFFTTEIFLTIFCAMFLAIVHAHRRSMSAGVTLATRILWTVAPVYWVASLVVLGDHPTAMLVWIVGLALTSAIVTAAAGAGGGLGVWLAAAPPLLLWCATHLSREWLTSGLITVSAVYAIALAAQLYRESERSPFGAADIVWLHLNPLLMFAGAYLLLDAFRSTSTAPVAAALSAWNGALAAGLLARHRDRAIHFAGVAFTLLMIAIGLAFDGAAITIGWAAEGAIVIALGLRERREWLRDGGAALFLVALARAADLLTEPAPVNQTPILNAHAACAAFLVLLCYALAWLHARRDRHGRIEIALGLVAAQLVTVLLITSEINAYWSAAAGALTRELATSVAWAVYATLLIVIGLRRDYAPIRYFAIVMFAVTTAKVFFVDTAHLERVYRILSVIGLGIALLVTSYLYQQTRQHTDHVNTPIDDLNGRI